MQKYFAPLAAVALLAAGSAGAEAKTTLRLTLQLPLKSVLGQNIQMFKNEVEKESKGDLEIQVYDSGSLYQDKDVPKAVGTGQVDMGVASLARFVGDVPAADVFYIPALFDTDSKLRAAVAPGSPVRGRLDAAIAKTGSKVLWWQAYGSTILLTKGDPIKTPEELKGKKVRVFGKLLGTWVSANGGSPVNVSGSEQYFAYQRGTVDIGMTGPDTIKSRKMWDVMKSVTRAGQAAIEFVVLVNDKVWSKLTPAQQKIITTASLNAEKTLRDKFGEIEKESVAAGKANGMTIYDPTPEENAKWRASAAAVRDSFLSGSGALGKEVYDAAIKLK